MNKFYGSANNEAEQILKLYGSNGPHLTVGSYNIPSTNKILKYISVTGIEASPQRYMGTQHPIEKDIIGYHLQFKYLSSINVHDNLASVSVLFGDGTEVFYRNNESFSILIASTMAYLGIDGDGSISQSVDRFLLSKRNPNFEMWPEEDRDEYIYVDTTYDAGTKTITKLYGSVNGQSKLVYQGFGHISRS